MDGPVQELTITAPQRDTIRLQTVHFKGDRRKYPKFDLDDQRLELEVQEEGNLVTVSSGDTRLVIQKRIPAALLTTTRTTS